VHVHGGCLIYDLGYYPFSSHFFSDLTHYVRSADFLAALLDEPQNLGEYAFGPLKGLGFRVPTPDIERMFEDSFAAAVKRTGNPSPKQGRGL
jgi:hypothetical protein